jgi:hypothetical protein
MIQPKTVPIECADGTSRDFVLSKFPACAGREILTQYPVTAMPKIGDYPSNETLMLKVLSHVAAVGADGREIQLSTGALVDNHVPDAIALMRIEVAAVEYNFGFFLKGLASTFLGGIEGKAKALISQTLTDFLAQSSAKVSPPTKNSKPSTRSKKH